MSKPCAKLRNGAISLKRFRVEIENPKEAKALDD